MVTGNAPQRAHCRQRGEWWEDDLLRLAAAASSGLPVTFTVSGPATIYGSLLTATGTGTVMVTASQAGNSTYAAAPTVTRTFTVQ
jgi:hypothetical protein